jgi:hypothetical protein
MRSVLSLVLLLAGCVTPRSMTLGMLAAPLGTGTEVGVFSGVGYSSQTGPVITTTGAGGEQMNQQTQNRAFSIPAFEANVQKGLSDRFALNFHLSPAGVQPGVKWTVNRSRITHLAILPALGVGYGSVGTSDFVAQPTGAQFEQNPRATTSFTFLSGLKFLISHQSGFYAGVGYDFVFNRSNSSSAPSANADRTEIVTQTSTHQIMGAVGFSIVFGTVSLRPEIAFAVNPALSQTINSRVGAISAGSEALTGGFSWAILPGFTLGVITPTTKAAAEEEERDQPAVREDEEEEEEEPKPRKGPARKKVRSDDDDDQKPQRKRSGENDAED